MNIRTFLLIFFLLLTGSITVFSQAENPSVKAQAQSWQERTTTDKSEKTYKFPSGLKTYLEEKYRGQITSLSLTVDRTQRGTTGSLYILGHIKPKNVAPLSGDKQTQARAIAKDFLDDEREKIGLPPVSELRERAHDTSQNGEYTDIYFDRYINDTLLEYAAINMTIAPDLSITGLQAILVSVPDELYQATTKKTISEEEALKVVKHDLKEHAIDLAELNILHSRTIAITTPPYVIWDIDVNLKHLAGRWRYSVDAFTGEVKEKRDRMIID